MSVNKVKYLAKVGSGRGRVCPRLRVVSAGGSRRKRISRPTLPNWFSARISSRKPATLVIRKSTPRRGDWPRNVSDILLLSHTVTAREFNCAHVVQLN
jgi:hypothetical protein